jgi:hypothetical protein
MHSDYEILVKFGLTEPEIARWWVEPALNTLYVVENTGLVSKYPISKEEAFRLDSVRIRTMFMV